MRYLPVLAFLLLAGTSRAQVRKPGSDKLLSFVSIAEKDKPLVVTFFAYWNQASLQRLQEMETIAYTHSAKAKFIAVTPTAPNWPEKKIRNEYSGGMELFIDVGSGYMLGVGERSIGIVYILDPQGQVRFTKYINGKSAADEILPALEDYNRQEAEKKARLAQTISPLDKSSAAAYNLCSDLKKIAAVLEAGDLFPLTRQPLSAWGVARIYGAPMHYMLREDVPANSPVSKSVIAEWAQKLHECLPDWQEKTEQAGGFADLLKEEKPQEREFRNNGATLTIMEWESSVSGRVNIVLRVFAGPGEEGSSEGP